MPYDEDSIVTSEVAGQVFSVIISKGQSYSTEIAEELSRDRTLVSKILSELVEVGVLEKGKRTKAQYYKPDYEGLTELSFGLWENEIGKEIPKKYRKDDVLNAFLRSYFKRLKFMRASNLYSELTKVFFDKFRTFMEYEKQDWSVVLETDEFESISGYYDFLISELQLEEFYLRAIEDSLTDVIYQEASKDEIELQELSGHVFEPSCARCGSKFKPKDGGIVCECREIEKEELEVPEEVLFYQEN
ncbi:MAG: winged helix-turn-helix domain-containing protein [Candidatus Nanohaloarchaea archaeon]